MRPIKALFIVIIAVISFAVVEPNYANQWYFSEWTTDITIHSDASFTVREIQAVDNFESASFLKRNIELAGLEKVTNINIYNEKGIRLTDEEAEIQYNADKIRIKITPKVKKKSETWIIEYTIYGGIRFEKDGNELQWNVLPSDKQAPIDKINIFVYLPQEVPKEKLEQLLLIESSGSEISSPDCSIISGKVLKYWAEEIGYRDDITIIAKWPKGILREDRWRKLKPYLWFLLPISIFTITFAKWWSSNHSLEARRRVIPNPNPPKELSPSALHALLDGKLDKRNIVASIVDLANRGFIKVIEQDKRSVLTSYKHNLYKAEFDSATSLRNHEKIILKQIFSDEEIISMSEVKEHLKESISGINKTMWNEPIKSKLIIRKPKSLKRRYLLTGILFAVLGAIAFTSSRNAGIAIFLSGMILSLLGRNISPLTTKGMESKWQGLGFRKNLQLKLNPSSNQHLEPELFSEYLPYAIIFGIEEEWADLFADMPESLPDWYYSSDDASSLSVIDFVKSLSSVIVGYSVSNH